MAWSAGCIDVVGWLAFHHVYVSHMTGNTASFARTAMLVSWKEAARYLWPVVPFMAGLLYSGAVTKVARHRGFHFSVSMTLATELALLVIVLLSGIDPFISRTLLAAAMGIQTLTVTRVKGLRVYTTYMTGSLAKCAEAVVDFATWFYRRTSGRSWNRFLKALRLSPRRLALQHAALTAGLWIGFGGGALAGAFGFARWRTDILWVPMALLAGAIVMDIVSPVTASDEPAERWSAH